MNKLKFCHQCVVDLFKSGKTSLEISNCLHIPLSSVQRIIRNNNIRIIITQEDVDKIIENYKNGIVPKDISNKFNYKISKVYSILRNNNVLLKKCQIRKYKYDESYFLSIDNCRKAYFFGLIAADGCNTGGGLAISLVESDSYILEELKNDIKYDGYIRKLNARKLSQNNQKILSINGKFLSQQLTDLGISKNKSLTLIFPNIKRELLPHFIRGYFDGDGCVSVENNKVRCINFVGSKNMIETLCDIFTNNLSIKCNKIRKIKNIYSLNITNKDGFIKLYKYMYNGSELFLLRKREKFNHLNNLKNIF